MSYKEDKELASSIVNTLLVEADKIDYVLELVCSSLIMRDPQLANKLHVAMANTTNKLLNAREDSIVLTRTIVPYAYHNKSLSKLSCEARITYMLDICRVVFPNARLENASEHTKSIFNDTIYCVKEVIKAKNIKSRQELFDSYSYKQSLYNNSYNYLVSLVVNNNII